ncbi:MAG: BolA/IbaG family iron-sulfur metabolism protein [Acidobacteria bacterium]|nr:BolA/IbaG family iron-sulfur metabolism protein [Acidobacteriota bacterium]
MSRVQNVQELLAARMPDAIVEVRDMTGTDDHLAVLVASDIFIGKPLLDQHRLVMSHLQQQLDTAEVHAVRLKTVTLDSYHERQLKEGPR